MEGDVAPLDRSDGGPGQGRHAHPPLLAHERLDHVVTAIAVADLVDIGLLTDHRPLLAEGLGDLATSVLHREAVETGEVGDVHGPVQPDHVDDRETVADADLVVGGIVAGGDLECTGAEGHLDRRVGDDRDAPAGEGKDDVTAHQVPVAGIVGIHRHRGVPEHRLGTDRGHDHLAAALHGVAQAGEGVVVLDPFDLLIADGAAIVGAPIDDAGAPVDQSLVEEGLEDGADGPHVGLVQGESRARPVAGEAEPAHLLVDAAAAFLIPGVHPGLEGGASDRLAAGALRDQLALDHRVGGDGGVIGAGAPLDLGAAHPPVAGQDVLDREAHGVAHVQRGGDVGRR